MRRLPVRAARALALAAALALPACTLFPPYQRPPVQTPESFRGQAAPAPVSTSQSLADLDWGEVYRDPVLEKLISTALAQNYDMLIAAARVEQFQALASVAGLGSIPLVYASGVRGGNKYSTVGPTPFPSTASTTSNSYTANIVASYEIDFWGRISNAQAAAKADLLTSEYARETVRISLIANVATTYFALRTLDRQLEITRRTLAAREKFFALTRAQFQRGVVSGLDVNRAEASVATARAAIPDLQRQTTQTENLLQVLLGQNPGPILRDTSAGASFPVPPEVPAGLPASLLDRRPDLRQAESNLVSANAQLKSVKASLFPTISLTATLGSLSKALAGLFTGPAGTWAWGLGFLQPIIDLNRNTYQVDVSTAREKEAILAYQATVSQAFREVADALAARQGYAEQLVAQEDQVRALRAASQQVLKRYAAGYSSYFEVIDADGSLFAAELLLAQAYQNSLASFVQLYRSLGGGWAGAKLIESPS
jgi:outer membrane protein, multidrug efflux system